jgi:hypothetical protein
MPKPHATVRQVPRPFSLHWGNGQIVEEATATTPYHEPAIQLLEFEDGSLSVRFCYYDPRGRFQRSPLMVGEQAILDLRKSLRECPRVRSLLKSLTE